MDVVDAGIKLIEAAARLGRGVDQLTRDPILEARLRGAVAALGPFGVDPFGLDPSYLARVIPPVAWLYRSYFRVEARGVEHIPAGRCLLVANHSGQLPFDAAMIGMAAFLEREPPRVVRSMVERFVPATPFVSPFLARCGQILGTPENCRRLLEADEAIQIFPEGVRGLNKTWRHRYRLQPFGQGFMRLAMETRAPLVPTVVVGAEEQAPSVANLSALGRLLGLPALPVTLTPLFGLLPLPTRYRIVFGPPVVPEGDPNDEDEVIVGKVERLKRTMRCMLESAVAAREHIFW